MSSLVEVVPLMSPEERKQVRGEIDGRHIGGFAVSWLLMPEGEPHRVEVVPDSLDDDVIPYGLKVVRQGIEKSVFEHPNAFLGQLAVEDAILASQLDSTFSQSEAA